MVACYRLVRVCIRPIGAVPLGIPVLCPKHEGQVHFLKVVLNSGIFEISILYIKNIVLVIHKKFLRGRWSYNVKEEKYLFY